jgi:hypothetical protein
MKQNVSESSYEEDAEEATDCAEDAELLFEVTQKVSTEFIEYRGGTSDMESMDI